MSDTEKEENEFKIIKVLNEVISVEITFLARPKEEGGVDLKTAVTVKVGDDDGGEEMDNLDYLMNLAVATDMLLNSFNNDERLTGLLSQLGITTGDLKIVNRFSEKINSAFADLKFKNLLGARRKVKPEEGGEGEPTPPFKEKE